MGRAVFQVVGLDMGRLRVSFEVGPDAARQIAEVLTVLERQERQARDGAEDGLTEHDAGGIP